MPKTKKMNPNTAATLVIAYYLFILMSLMAVVYGWVYNLLTLMYSSDVMSTGQLIVRAVGCFLVPLGAVMGYIAP